MISRIKRMLFPANGFSKRTAFQWVVYLLLFCSTSVFVSILAVQLTTGFSPGFRNGRSLVFSFLGVMVFLAILSFCLRKRNVEESAEEDEEEDLLDQSDLPSRFSFKDLESATGNFHKDKRLGEGGFGSVFEGNIGDGTKVAVKRLDPKFGGQGRKEFLAEVKTIGSIHHVNLVKLLGYCAQTSHKLLVYEYMRNGSLDKWIFNPKPELILDWKTRSEIILGIAKGLSYLHEGCQKRIIHLDIKPQNILLDGEFKAKLSDFGLARFIDRDQSRVETAIRGTRGYLAPDWFLNTKISEKVDVYSFGVVILEVMCGRKNLDYSRTDEYEPLLHLVKRKAEENQLFEVVDKQSEDMQQHMEEAVKMVRTAIWCLQADHTKRPSISMVVKVLEGVMEVEKILDYSFLSLSPMQLPKENVVSNDSDPQLPSILSGPR